MAYLRPLSLLVLPLLCLFAPSPTLSSECPAFLDSSAACGQSSCGHFVFRGKFDLRTSRSHRVKGAANGLRLGAQAAPGDCCRQCRTTDGCTFWNFFPGKRGACFLYDSLLCTARNSSDAPYMANVEGSFVGGRCNDAPAVIASSSADASSGPMAVSFPLLPERPFCLLSDPDLHINMLLGGYLDERSLDQQGRPKARVWIREIGFVWTDARRVKHSLRVAARKAPSMERGDGFVDKIEVDGTAVPTMMLGDEVNLFDGQASIVYDAREKSGPVDVDRFNLRIDNVLEADLFARPAHPMLQHTTDAMVHLNLDIAEVQYSPSVHGVLGQSYRSTKDSEESNLDYNVLSQLIQGSDASKGPFTLQGRAEDYWSSSVLAPDCKYSQFGKAVASLPVVPGQGIAAKPLAMDQQQEEIVKEAEEVAQTLRQEDEVAVEIVQTIHTAGSKLTASASVS